MAVKNKYYEVTNVLYFVGQQNLKTLKQLDMTTPLPALQSLKQIENYYWISKQIQT